MGEGMMGQVALTVLLATRNGERVLARTLDGYRRLEAPPVRWKMVLVDNGSVDSTPEIVKSFKQHLPLELLTSLSPGKNRALNAGLEAVEGRLLIITDDDAIPDPTFLGAWAKLLSTREEYGLFGGSIQPLFEVPPPPWMLRSRLLLAMMFGERCLREGPIGPGEIFGANMAMRTSVLARGLRFDENLGPNGLDPLYRAAGETEFCLRVARAGTKCWFAREPVVRHIVRPEQFTRKAWANRAYRLGRARAYLKHRDQDVGAPARSTHFSDRFSEMRRRAHEIFLNLQMFSPIPEKRYRRSCVYNLARGFGDECAKLAQPSRGNTVAANTSTSKSEGAR